MTEYFYDMDKSQERWVYTNYEDAIDILFPLPSDDVTVIVYRAENVPCEMYHDEYGDECIEEIGNITAIPIRCVKKGQITECYPVEGNHESN